MELNITKMTEDMAKEISKWKYPDKYSVYNIPSWEKMCELNFGLTNKNVRKNEFTAIINNHNLLCGYFRLGEREGGIKIGIGLKPSLCGQGLGIKIMELLKSECFNRYGNKNIILDVRTFNERAIKTYKKSGFQIVKVVNRKTINGEDEFYRMEYKREN